MKYALLALLSLGFVSCTGLHGVVLNPDGTFTISGKLPEKEAEAEVTADK